MNRTFIFLLLTVLLSACGTQTANQKDTSSSSEAVPYRKANRPLKRKNFKFTYSFAKNDEGNYAYIEVEGWIDKNTIAFTSRSELVEEKENMPDGEGWVTETDINFDGKPDLLIYLGLQAWGQVASFYDAYVWNETQHRFDHVDIFSSIGEPLIDSENHCITSTGRNGPDHLVTQKYEWKDGELVLTEEKTVEL